MFTGSASLAYFTDDPTASNLNVPDPRVVLATDGLSILMPRTVADELRPRVRNLPLPSPS